MLGVRWLPDPARLPLLALAAATGLVASLAPSAAAQPATPAAPAPPPPAETTWETGIISGIADGDTVYVDIKNARNPGFVAPAGQGRSYCSNRSKADGKLPKGGLTRCRVRLIGVQAPEKAGAAGGSALQQCRATLATAQLRALLPVGTSVRLRAMFVNSREDQYSGGRLARTVHQKTAAGVWEDVGRRLLASGYVLWFPFGPGDAEKPETANNLEYRRLVDQAAAARRGLWSPNLCGPSAPASVSVAVLSDPIGDDRNREYAMVTNHATTPLDISGWVVRDSSLTTFTFPAGTVLRPGGFVRVWSGTGPPGMPATDFRFGGPAQLFANWSTAPGRFSGDAAYLFDRQPGFSYGNLRAWVHLPCVGAGCADPLVGKVRLGTVMYNPPGRDTPGKEYVDLVNQSARPVGLSGYALTRRGSQFPLPQGLTLGPKSTLRVVIGKGTNKPGVVYMGRTSTLLSNSGDLVALARLDNATVDCKAWGSLRCTQLPAAVAPSPPPAAPTASRTRRPVTTPRKVHNVIAATEKRRIVVAWQPPTKDGGAAVRKYRVTFSQKVKGKARTVAKCTVKAPTQSCTSNNLPRKHTYSVSVQARNTKGYGRASTPVTVRVR